MITNLRKRPPISRKTPLFSETCLDDATGKILYLLVVGCSPGRKHVQNFPGSTSRRVSEKRDVLREIGGVLRKFVIVGL